MYYTFPVFAAAVLPRENPVPPANERAPQTTPNKQSAPDPPNELSEAGLPNPVATSP